MQLNSISDVCLQPQRGVPSLGVTQLCVDPMGIIQDHILIWGTQPWGKHMDWSSRSRQGPHATGKCPSAVSFACSQCPGECAFTALLVLAEKQGASQTCLPCWIGNRRRQRREPLRMHKPQYEWQMQRNQIVLNSCNTPRAHHLRS